MQFPGENEILYEINFITDENNWDYEDIVEYIHNIPEIISPEELQRARIPDEQVAPNVLTLRFYHGPLAKPANLRDVDIPNPWRRITYLRIDPEKSIKKGRGLEEDKETMEKAVKGTTTVIGKVSSKILPGSDVVLDKLGDFLVDNVKKIMDQKDIAKRTKKMIEHYNRVKNDTLLHPVTRSKLLNIIRQQYNKNLTQDQQDDFTEQYESILAADPQLTGPRKTTGVPSKSKQQAKTPRSGIQSNLVDKSGEKVYMLGKRFGKGLSSQHIYCLRCKDMTGTSNITKVTTRNNRHMLKGICDDCGANKNKFVSK